MSADEVEDTVKSKEINEVARKLNATYAASLSSKLRNLAIMNQQCDLKCVMTKIGTLVEVHES